MIVWILAMVWSRMRLVADPMETNQADVDTESSEVLRVATARFDVGRVDLLSVIQQQALVISAKVDLLNIRDQRLQSRIDLHLALGSGFEESTDDDEEE